jgi:nitrate reductase assembly molybdenum cofactor insertion protein NarJ
MLARLAELLRYPDARLAERSGDDAGVHAFFEEIAHVAPEGMEELYTRTFDLNPVATLELGWHLWGEQYERGRFLADLRALQDGLGLEVSSELPDHLTAVLLTLARMDRPEPLAGQIAPALEKIARPLDEHGNPYRHLIHATISQVTKLGPAASPHLRGEDQGEGQSLAPAPGNLGGSSC